MYQDCPVSNQLKEQASRDQLKETFSCSKCINLMDDLPGEIVAYILQRLHPKHLFRCKQVSKRWESLISGHEFGRNYLKQASSSIKPASSLSRHLVDIPCPYEHWRMMKAFVTIDGEIDDEQPPFRACIVPRNARIEGSDHAILASSNGLILSGNHDALPYNLVRKLKLFVFNPLTNQCVPLPLLKGPFSQWGFGFATRPGPIGGDNAAFVTYKVVFLQGVIGSLDLVIDIFSSDTGNWTARKVVSRRSSMVFNMENTSLSHTHKGILHWFDQHKRTIVTYDPYDSPDRFGSIGLPNGGSVVVARLNLIQLGHEDSLKYCEIVSCCDTDKSLLVWRLVDRDKGEWCLEHRYSISPLQSFQLSNNIDSIRKQLYSYSYDCLNHESFRSLIAEEKEVSSVDLQGAKEAVSYPFKVMAVASEGNRSVSVALCPWSSPFYGQFRLAK